MLLYGTSDSLFRHLQSIQNVAARFLAGASRHDHISPVLRGLHWLPVKQWVDYKLATLLYKLLRGQVPSYVVDDCQLIADSGRPQLRSAHAMFSLFQEQTLDLATGVSRLLIWEFGTVYLPQCGSLSLNLDTLKDLFKGISVWQNRGALVTFWFQCAMYKSIYLLTYLLTYCPVRAPGP